MGITDGSENAVGDAPMGLGKATEGALMGVFDGHGFPMGSEKHPGVS